MFLDGFDEVSYERRQRISNEIHKFVTKYGKNAVIVTSRPDPELESWPQFTVLKIAPLTLDQATALVAKLSFDENLKSSFIKDLKSDLFKKHKSFLSNPLLLSIMLLTYGENATIPTKLTVFYNQAYEALFDRHDAMKGGYKRNRKTQLDIEDFAKLFTAFCVRSYHDRKLIFNKTEALSSIDEAQNLVNIHCNREQYLLDLVQSVCLLVEDGTQLTYAHRSFQEYFAARYIASAPSEQQERLINIYSDHVDTDNLIGMLYEMRPDIVEQHFILKNIDYVLNAIGYKKSIGMTHHKKYVLMFFDKIESTDDSSSAFGARNRLRRNIYPSIAYILDLLGHTVDIAKNKPLVKQQWPLFHQLIVKHCASAPNHKIDLNKGPWANNFIKECANSEGHMSIKEIRTLVSIRDVIRTKMKLRQESFEQTLRVHK